MKREPEPAVADETTDRSEHLEGVPLGRARHQTHELRTVVVDPTIDPRKARTVRKLSKPGEAPQPWQSGPSAAGGSRTVGGATMQVPTVGATPPPADVDATGGVAESIAAQKLKARRTMKIDETAPLPDVAPRAGASTDEGPEDSPPGIDVPPPSGAPPDPRLLAEVTPPGPQMAKKRARKRPLTPTPLGLGAVEAQNEPGVDEPYDLEDDKITRPIRRVPQDLAEADTRRLPTVPTEPTAPVAPQAGFPWPIAAATGVALLALFAYLLFGPGDDAAAPSKKSSDQPTTAPESAVVDGAAAEPRPAAPGAPPVAAAKKAGEETPLPAEDDPKPADQAPASNPEADPEPTKAAPSSTGRIF